jgi:hypothetical protein
MDLNYYIDNIREVELGLVSHSNENYSFETVKRVNEVYKDGIEVFKQPGDDIKDI